MSVGDGIVLGASSGIGRALTELLAAAGSTLTALSRSGNVPNVNSSSIHSRAIDIRDYGALFSAIGAAKELHNVQFVVNCVGVGFYAPIGADYSEAWNEILATNVIGVLNLLSAVDNILPDLERFVHVSSMAAHRVSRVPGNLCYSVSKAAARTIVEEYRRSVREGGRQTRVSMVSPGFVEGTAFATKFFQHAKDTITFDPYSPHTNLSPYDVANIIMNILDQPPHIELADMLLLPSEQPA